MENKFKVGDEVVFIDKKYKTLNFIVGKIYKIKTVQDNIIMSENGKGKQFLYFEEIDDVLLSHRVRLANAPKIRKRLGVK